MVVALVVYDVVMVRIRSPWSMKAAPRSFFSEVQDRINDAIPEEAPQWIVGRYEELIARCEAEAAGTDA